MSAESKIKPIYVKHVERIGFEYTLSIFLTRTPRVCEREEAMITH